MNVVYLDCFSGISGDMVLGAFIDAGLPLAALREALGRLAPPEIGLGAARVLRTGVSATKFSVLTPAAAGHAHHHHDDGHGPASNDAHAHRSVAEILALVDTCGLSAAGKARARALFGRLADAEAAIHQMPVDRIHLHEVGAIDSIIDVVGAVFAFEWAAPAQVVCSPLNVGGGMVRSAHGHFPVPAPATVVLLGDAPIYSGAVQKELVTPTGALIATSYADRFGPLPAMAVERVGYGAGDRDDPDTPNVLRVLIGRATASAGLRGVTDAEADVVVVLECEIDDMNPQLFGVVMERLYAAGALEVFYVPVQMKKNRPGTLLTVVAPPALRVALADIVFAETTTIGLRYAERSRDVLPRRIVAVETPLGTVRMKVATRGGRVVNAVPEFDDCASLAAAHGVPVKAVQAMAVRAYAAGVDDVGHNGGRRP